MRSALTLSLLFATVANAQVCNHDAPSPLASVAGAVGGIHEARATALCAETKLGAIIAPGIPVPPAAAGRLIVVNKGPSVGDPGKSSVMSIDLATGELEWSTDTAQQGPHEIATSPDGRYGVAPNYGLAPQGKPPLPGEGKSISVVDYATGKVRDIFIGEYSRPHGGDFIDAERIAVTADGTDGDLSKGYVLVVNIRTGKIEKAMPTGQAGTHLVRVSPDRTKLFASNIQGESFSVLDVATGKLLATIRAGKGSEGFDYSRDGKEIWIGNQDDSTITIVDANTFAVKETIPAPGGPIRVLFSADGSRVFTSDRAGNSITAYDAKSRKITGSVTMDIPKCDAATRKPLFGKSSVPMQLVIPPGSRYGYIANSHSDLITVVDLTEMSIQGYYKAGTKPDPMAWAAAPAGPI